MRMGLVRAGAVVAAALVAVLAAPSAAPSRAVVRHVGFREALTAARRPFPSLPATDIALHTETRPPVYAVTLLGGEGIYQVSVDAGTGEVLGTSMARVVPSHGSFRQPAVEELQRSGVTLERAIETTERVLGAEGLREVMLQLWNGRVVIEVIHVQQGAGVGHVLDARTGRILVGGPPPGPSS